MDVFRSLSYPAPAMWQRLQSHREKSFYSWRPHTTRSLRTFALALSWGNQALSVGAQANLALVLFSFLGSPQDNSSKPSVILAATAPSSSVAASHTTPKLGLTQLGQLVWEDKELWLLALLSEHLQGVAKCAACTYPAVYNRPRANEQATLNQAPQNRQILVSQGHSPC